MTTKSKTTTTTTATASVSTNFYSFLMTSVSVGESAAKTTLARLALCYMQGATKGDIDKQLARAGYAITALKTYHQAAKRFADTHGENVPAGNKGQRAKAIERMMHNLAQGRAESMGIQVSANIICDTLNKRDSVFVQADTHATKVIAAVKESLTGQTAKAKQACKKHVEKLESLQADILAAKNGKASNRLPAIRRGIDKAVKAVEQAIATAVNVLPDSGLEQDSPTFKQALQVIKSLESEKAVTILSEACARQFAVIRKEQEKAEKKAEKARQAAERATKKVQDQKARAAAAKKRQVQKDQDLADVKKAKVKANHDAMQAIKAASA